MTQEKLLEKMMEDPDRFKVIKSLTTNLYYLHDLTRGVDMAIPVTIPVRVALKNGKVEESSAGIITIKPN